jgi:hypothetical protein
MNLKEHFQRWEEVFCFPCVNYECGICDRSLKEKKDCYSWQYDESNPPPPSSHNSE